MKPRRWVIVDERVTPEQSRRGIEARYYSRGGWEFRLSDALKFYSWDEALASVNGARDAGMSVAIVPLRSEVTSRAHAAAQAAEDNVATLRAELEGLRATDAEMAAKLAQAKADLAGAEQLAKEAVARCTSWESAYTLARRREEIMCDALGVQNGECIDEVAKRVVRERDEARKALAPPLPHVAFLQRLSDATGIEVASDDFEVRVLTFVHDLASMRSEILDIAARTPRAVTVKASPC